MLTDTGPIVALLDEDDNFHSSCVAASKRLPTGPLLTTWPCFTEAMYLLGEVGGYRYQARLWAMRSSAALQLHDLTPEEIVRMAALMDKYSDTPMDLADALLVVVAESHSLKRIFTVDSDFYVYRLADGTALEVIR